MRILGEGAHEYAGEGTGFLFPSAAWHLTEHSEQGVWKVAFFFGRWLA